VCIKAVTPLSIENCTRKQETSDSIHADIIISRVAILIQRKRILVQVMSPIPSVGRSVCMSVCPVYYGKTADWIWMPFGVVSRLGPRMRQVNGGGDRPAARGSFRGGYGAFH